MSCLGGIGIIASTMVVVGLICHVCRHWGEWHDSNCGYDRTPIKGVDYD